MLNTIGYFGGYLLGELLKVVLEIATCDTIAASHWEVMPGERLWDGSGNEVRTGSHRCHHAE